MNGEAGVQSHLPGANSSPVGPGRGCRSGCRVGRGAWLASNRLILIDFDSLKIP